MSLDSRVYRSRSYFQPPKPSATVRPHQYKNWEEYNLKEAYEAVKSGSMSLRRAAEEFQVPRSTLHDRLSGKVKFGSTASQRYLSDNEETDLVRFLLKCAVIGFPKSRKEVISMVQKGVGGKHGKLNARKRKRDRKRASNVIIAKTEQETG